MATGKLQQILESKVDLKGKEEEAIEIVTEVEPELEVEVKTEKKETKKVESEDDEVEKYSEKVQKRINKLTYDYNEEKRRAEKVTGERDEATRVAQQLLEENKKIRSSSDNDRGVYVKELKEKVELELSTAKKSLKEAYEAGNPDGLADAQEAISKATMRKEYLERYQPRQETEKSTGQTEKTVVQSTQELKQSAQPDPDATAWQKKNKWFGEDDEMTSFAFGVHQKLIKEGVSPATDSDKYYSRINARMRQVFPEYEWGDETTEKETTPQKKPATIVASVQRTSKGTKVTLSTSQIALARKLGVTPDQYARELIKQQETK